MNNASSTTSGAGSGRNGNATPQAEYPALCDGVPGGTGTASCPQHTKSLFLVIHVAMDIPYLPIAEAALSLDALIVGTLNLSLFPVKARFCPSYMKKTTLYKLRAKLARSSRTEKKQGSEGLAPAPHAYSSTMADSCFSMSFMRPHSSA